PVAVAEPACIRPDIAAEERRLARVRGWPGCTVGPGAQLARAGRPVRRWRWPNRRASARIWRRMNAGWVGGARVAHAVSGSGGAELLHGGGDAQDGPVGEVAADDHQADGQRAGRVAGDADRGVAGGVERGGVADHLDGPADDLLPGGAG